MKYVLMTVVALIAGVVLGVLTTTAEKMKHPEVIPPMPVDSYEWVRTRGKSNAPSKGITEGKFARVEVEGGEEFDFGDMELGESSSHTFILRNTGELPLTLVKGQTTCKCTTTGDLDKEPIPPGGTTEVTLSWTAKVRSIEFEKTFEQSAEIGTNDPDRKMIRLRVKGQVSQTIEFSPGRVVLGDMTNDKPVSRQVILTFNRPGEFTIEKPYIADADWREYFEIDHLPVKSTTVDGDQRTAYAIKVATKPGLPKGRIQQLLKVKTSYPNIPEVEIPIEGVVQGDVTISGSKYVASYDEIRWGQVASDKGSKCVLLLTCRGDWVPKLEVTVDEVFPAEIVKAEIREPSSRSGATAVWTVNLTIPPGTSPIDRLGPDAENAGRIVLKTNHPDFPKFTIPVKFAVVEDLSKSTTK